MGAGSGCGRLWRCRVRGGSVCARLGMLAFSDAPTAYIGLAICLVLGVAFALGVRSRRNLQGPDLWRSNALAQRRQKRLLRRMGFTQPKEA